MNMAVILKHLDELLNDCKLDEAGEFLSESLNEAFRVEDYMSAITLYNEQIGFFRDCGMFDKAIDSCENVIVLIYKCHLENTAEHATTLLNVANAYRAAGKHDKSFEAYRKVRYMII
jgi:tetratricopeptide (TPR) repeat protein